MPAPATQRPTPILSIAPVTLAARHRDEQDALAAANGRDLLQEQLTRWMAWAGIAVALAAAVRAAVGAG